MDPQTDREQRLLDALLVAEATERARIADALHDDTIGAMTAAAFAVDRAARQLHAPDLSLASQLLSQAIERARRLMFDLSPALLRQFGLAAAIESQCHQASLCAGFEVELEVTSERFAEPVEELVYRTVREAVLNAKRHSGARRLRVAVAGYGDVVRGIVEDDGEGFDRVAVRERADAPLHLGLIGLGERLSMSGGWLVVDSAPGSGTRVCFQVPAR